MTFEFKPAIRENVTLIIGLAAASGGGKTKSALELASGLSPSGKIGFIDTEARRALHYAKDYNFFHSDMRPPFTPDKFIEGIHAAEAAGMEVVIIDSASHEYDGEGGILDWAHELEEGTPKRGIENPRTQASGDKDWWKDWETKPVKSPGNWKEPKLAHKEMMNALLQCRAHIIFCLRADEKIRIVPPTKDNGFKTQIEPLGWTPICEKRFMFEMTLSLTLRPDNPGKPDFTLPHKMQDQHRHMFPQGQYITKETGRMLGEWAKGNEDDIKANNKAILDEARTAARNGKAAFAEHWKGIDRDERAVVNTIMADIETLAKAADSQTIEGETVNDDGYREPASEGLGDDE